MRRFFINSQAIQGEKIIIIGSDAHHIRDVLRLSGGAKITVIDERAFEHEIELLPLKNEAVVGKIIATRRPIPPAVSITLFQGLPKGRKFDSIVEKATELGVNSINPVIMERTVVKPGADTSHRLLRWQRIAKGACELSGQAHLPAITSPIPWSAFIDKLGAYDLVVVFWEGATAPIGPLFHDFQARSIALIIGPEGGLSAGEIQALQAAGAFAVWLGPRILRTETAPIVALAIVNHLLGR